MLLNIYPEEDEDWNLVPAYLWRKRRCCYRTGQGSCLKGHTVHFFSQSAPFRLGAFSSNIHYHEVEAMHYPLFECPFHSLALASKIAEVAFYEKLDVVHAHYAIPHAMSAMLARQMLEDKCPNATVFVSQPHCTEPT